MDSFSEYANKRFFGTADVQDGPIQVVIEGFDKIELENDDGKEKASVMRCAGHDRAVILKSTTLGQLQDLFGKPSNAVGKTVELYLDKQVSFGGKKVGGLRIRGVGETGQASPF